MRTVAVRVWDLFAALCDETDGLQKSNVGGCVVVAPEEPDDPVARWIACQRPHTTSLGVTVAHYRGRNYPTVCPYVFYRDGGAALDYLTRVFGFTERMRTTTPDGGVGHAEVQLGESVVMIGCPPEFVTPKELGEVTVGLYIHVEDVDAHYRRALEAGAQPDEEPTDQPYGVRSYGVKDPEGHQWWFSQPLTAV